MTVSEAAPPPVAAPAKFGAGYRTYVLVLLTSVYTFNFVDRQIIGILSPAIKEDLGLADWQLGVLKGFAFAVLYTTLGIPIARLADRMNRVTIISVSLALWSGFTAISGACQNFTQLALARVGVGIGEAGGTPPAHSLISDYFPKEKRAGALGVYAMGIPIGVALAYLAGGWVTETFGWRWAFVVVGLPGVAAALLLKLTVREPQRGALEDANAPASEFRMAGEETVDGGSATVRQELAVILKAARHLLSIPTYRGIVIATAAISFTTYANGAWIVDFYSRSHPDFPILQVYFWLGIMSGTAYSAGTFYGGWLVDRFAARDKRMYGFVPAFALLVNAPCFLFSLWIPDPALSLAFQFPVLLSIGFYLGPVFALAQTLAPVAIRALSTAIFFFMLNMIALGFGPTSIGVLSSALMSVLSEERALRVALTVVTAIAVYAAWVFYDMGKRVPADWEKATGEKAA